MNLVFISNQDISAAKNAVEKIAVKPHQWGDSISTLDINFDIHDKLKHIVHNTIYIIDVHCTFKHTKQSNERQLKLQEQGGVIIYRHLLNLYKEQQDNLKVIFYSPIPKNVLINVSKGENYVLKLLPFIECKYDGSFEIELKKIVNGYKISNCHKFNNASENLLSGWGINNFKKGIRNINNYLKIKLPDKHKILIIDDQYSEWDNFYKEIFHNHKNSILSLKYMSQNDFRKAWDSNEAINYLLEKSKEASFVISDLYIRENHEQTKPFKNKNEIEEISGFQVFQKIKEQYPYLPYMLLTSSNKVWNYEAFNSNGIWSWCVKDNTYNLSLDDKQAQYTYFEGNLLKLCNDEWLFCITIWKKIIDLNKNVSKNKNKWWFHIDNNVLAELQECLISLDSIYSKRNSFETNYSKNLTARNSANIINILGEICETLKTTFKYINTENNNSNYIAFYIHLLRHYYSHGNYYKLAKPIEVVFCLDLMLYILDRNNLKKIDKTIQNKKMHQRHTNIVYHLQFMEVLKDRGDLYKNPKLQKKLLNSFDEYKNDVIGDEFNTSNLDDKRILNLIKIFKKSTVGKL